MVGGRWSEVGGRGSEASRFERKIKWAVERGWNYRGGRKSVVGCRRTEGGRRRVLVKRKGYNFELFKKVSFAKVGIVSDIL